MKVGPLFLDAASLLLPISMVELLLLQKFNHWYFSLGPTLLRFTARAEGPWRADEFLSSVNGLGYLSARKVGDLTILLRRGGSMWPFPWQLAPFWSPRIKLAVRGNEKGHTLSLELRYTICWPAFAVAAVLGLVVAALYVLLASYVVTAIVFLLVAGAIALYLYVAAVNARNDAYNTWELAKQHLSSAE